MYLYFTTIKKKQLLWETDYREEGLEGWERPKAREVHGCNCQYIQLVKTSFSVQVLELDAMCSHCKLFKLVLGNLG